MIPDDRRPEQARSRCGRLDGGAGPAPPADLPFHRERRLEDLVKKLFALALVAAAGLAVWRKMEADRAEQALWAEVTDPVK